MLRGFRVNRCQHADTSWHPAFLHALRTIPNVRLAARAVGVVRSDAYLHRDLFPEFATEWDEAIEAAIDSLESVLFQRARRSSDTLGIFMLKAHRSAIYRERNDNFNFNLTAEQLAQLSDEQLDKLIDRFTRR